QGEILLVIAHYRDQNFIGQREELRIEAAEHYGWKLGEIHHRVEQRLVFPPARARDGSSGCVKCFANALLAFGGTCYHRSLRQRGRVIGGPTDRQRSRRQNAMAF